MTVLATALLLSAKLSLAEPAPWYMWRSKLDGKQVCLQTSPGKGWERVSGPYKTHRC
jgi:hypothetical protein